MLVENKGEKDAEKRADAAAGLKMNYPEVKKVAVAAAPAAKAVEKAVTKPVATVAAPKAKEIKPVAVAAAKPPTPKVALQIEESADVKIVKHKKSKAEKK